MQEDLIAWLCAGGIFFPIMYGILWLVERKDKRK